MNNAIEGVKEKSNKCYQCKYTSSRVRDIKKHEQTHRMKETNKCNLCEYASSNAGFIRRHMKNINVTSAIIHPRVSRNTKTLTGSKRQTSAISVSMHLPVLAS